MSDVEPKTEPGASEGSEGDGRAGRDSQAGHDVQAGRDDPRAALAEYRRRRDFARTAEPAGESEDLEARRTGQLDARPVFVVQKHAASRLHYDLRLEMGGVLKSWAVPKGPSLDPAEKRLAVMTEDHPLEYAAFEGTIPEGEYGGGTVMLWDFGYWEPDAGWRPAGGGEPARPADPEAAVGAGELKFVLHGHKLAGSWVLVQMKGRGDRNWLLLKHRDDDARPGYDIEMEAPDSVASGRSLEQIAADGRSGGAGGAATGSATGSAGGAGAGGSGER